MHWETGQEEEAIKPEQRPSLMPAPTLEFTRRGARARRFVVLGTVILMGAAVTTGILLQVSDSRALPDSYSQVDLTVQGLHCEVWCPVRVDAALGRLPGVLDLAVDVAAGRVQVRYDASQITATQLAAALGGGPYSCQVPDSVLAVTPESTVRTPSR